MRTTLLLCLSLATITTGIAGPVSQKLNIEKATVFLNGAELQSTAKINLAKGENEVQFTNVAGDVNDQSIMVGATNGVVVESVTFQNNFLATEVISPKAREYKDSIEYLQNERIRHSNKISTFNEQITVLNNNRKVGGENTGLSVAELQKMLDLVGAKMENYLTARSKEEQEVKKIDERVAQLNRQLQEEQKKAYQPGGQLIVKFFAKEATQSNIGITYIVPNAGWTPTYDIWADDAHSPVKLFYKANIHQNSGVKWDDVKLSLSTGNPQEGMQSPVLSPWYLAFYVPQPRKMARSYNAPAANPNAGGAWTSSSSSASIAMTQDADLAALTTGTIDAYVQVDNSGVNTSFDIDLPYTIPSDGQQHLVAVKKYEAPATYQYLVRPKLDKDAFLIAKITHWEDFNLLAGPTNIFYEGTYVGHGYLDPHNVKDTIDISLGRDKKIVVKRDRDIKLRSVKTIGTNIRETFAYNITVRNGRKEAILIAIEDQQPVSNDKDIVIEDKETSGADYNETTGLMKWTCTIPANESKTLPFGYTIKYPKGKTIANLN